MKKMLMATLIGAMVSAVALGAEPVGDPVLDPPTLHCLGAYWIIRDTDAKPATVISEYRKVGTEAWLAGPPFIRVVKETEEMRKTKYGNPFFDEGGQPKTPAIRLAEDERMFAGSLFVLQPDTVYEWRLTLTDSDGTKIEKILKDKTIAEPVIPADMTKRYVIPGDGGGSGTQADPFKGLKAADAAAKPGDLFILQPGTYDAVKLTRSGTPGKPIVWQGVDAEKVIIDGKAEAKDAPSFAVNLDELHDIWFEKVTACNGNAAFRMHQTRNIVIRRCNMHNIIRGIYATLDTKDPGVRGLFISDNTIKGIFKFPVTRQEYADFGNSHGIWMSGMGNVACYNRVSNFKDGIDTDDSPRQTVSNDIHNNDISETFDDCVELDGSDRNVRCFNNRLTNTLVAVSFQPIHGGPVYAFNNVGYNIRGTPFKMHNAPAGCYIFHNTMMRLGSPHMMWSAVPIYNSWSRNNLFVGTEGRALDGNTKMIDCDFDYDGYAGWSGNVFMKWSNVPYATLEDVRAKCPVYKNVVVLDAASLFASGLKAPSKDQAITWQEELARFQAGQKEAQPHGQAAFDRLKIDMRLAKESPARGKGQPLPWFGSTEAPDLGAYQFGTEVPHYGPRPEVKP